MASSVELWLNFATEGQVEEWLCVLSIPLDVCGRFALRPLKWLRFLGYGIYGREGVLSATPGGPAVNDNVLLIPEDDMQYFFAADGLPRFVDPDAIYEQITTSSLESLGQQDFRENIVSRDKSCIVTNMPSKHCEACHILPHSKGDDYIRYVVEHRLGGGNPILGGKPIESINDPRNGLLLNNLLHSLYGTAEIAFLKTPNFGLSVDDIPTVPLAPTGQSRLTLQYFVPPSDNIEDLSLYNKDVRQPEDGEEWPLDTILDFAYCCTALKHWGLPEAIDRVHAQSDAIYHVIEEEVEGSGNLKGPEKGPRERPRAQNKVLAEEEEDMGGIDGARGSGDRNVIRRRNHNQPQAQKDAERPSTKRHSARKRPSRELEDASNFVMFFWRRSAAVGEIKRQRKEDKDSREKVEAWQRSQEPL